jgi:DNA-binding MarR family transcriptional regulator
MREITQLTRAMEILRKKVYAELPIQQIVLLLQVAENEGITMPELAAKCDMPQGTTSRNLRMLSSFVDKGSTRGKAAELKGHGLLKTEPSLYNRRSLAVFLTKKGKSVVAQLGKTLQPRAQKVQEAHQGHP